MIKRLNLVNSDACIHVIALQDDFSNSKVGTDFELALTWHTYVSAVGDVLFPAQDDRFARAMGLLFKECLATPTEPMAVVARRIASP
jgi:hypothetical protein